MRHWFVVSLAFTAACSSADVTDEFCHRLDSCNQLATSVDECTQDIASALDMLPQDDRDEVEHDLKQCLDRPSCDGFIACVSALLQ